METHGQTAYYMAPAGMGVWYGAEEESMKRILFLVGCVLLLAGALFAETGEASHDTTVIVNEVALLGVSSGSATRSTTRPLLATYR